VQPRRVEDAPDDGLPGAPPPVRGIDGDRSERRRRSTADVAWGPPTEGRGRVTSAYAATVPSAASATYETPGSQAPESARRVSTGAASSSVVKAAALISRTRGMSAAVSSRVRHRGSAGRRT
jgi:hypothetical protein